MTKSGGLTKGEALQRWAGLTPGQPVRPAVVPYKHKGSTYDQDGVRITGSRDFIDSVLSRLTGLLEQENGQTRLAISYNPSTDKETRRPTGAWCCYVQVHERGHEIRRANVAFGTGSPYQRELTPEGAATA